LNISVVIPVADGDRKWEDLLPDLRSLSENDEIIISSPNEDLKSDVLSTCLKVPLSCKIKFVTSNKGRAKQLNQGAQASSNEMLWFLHCDSHLSKDSINVLKEKFRKQAEAIYYFNLGFDNDGPALSKLNTVGVWLRSHILKLPFGDQGFAMTKNVFNNLGGFCEEASYGEDHLFIWKAHKERTPVICVGGRLITSARKYQMNGWLSTTTHHIWLTLRQAAPQALALLRMRGMK